MKFLAVFTLLAVAAATTAAYVIPSGSPIFRSAFDYAPWSPYSVSPYTWSPYTYGLGRSIYSGYPGSYLDYPGTVRVLREADAGVPLEAAVENLPELPPKSPVKPLAEPVFEP